MKISAAVGNKAPNHFADVRLVQTLINRHIGSLRPLLPLRVDGRCGPLTIGMIIDFQRRVVGFKKPDGRIDPNGKTFTALCANDNQSTANPRSGYYSPALLEAQIYHRSSIDKQLSPDQDRQTKALTGADYQKAAILLGIEVAAIKAVASVESRGDGFLSNGKPKVLFEGHWFSRFTNGKFDKYYPTLSYKRWTKKYYRGGTAEYQRYLSAAALDQEAAMKSTSWGRFQIMGFNHNKCGYTNVKDFVSEMHQNEGHHLYAFVNFLRSTGLDVHLKAKNWAAFARGYNGPEYAKNKYDTRIRQAYEAYSTEGSLT